jgi:PhnB protein
MTVQLDPYLGFRDQARDALEFYRSVFGGVVTVSTFGEVGAARSPADTDKVMHGQLVGDGIRLMASDSPSGMRVADASSISLALSGDDAAVLTRWWEGLAVGATVIEPLTPAPWGDAFGMLTDRFGVTWMVNVSRP